jgi:hypothetical protein
VTPAALLRRVLPARLPWSSELLSLDGRAPVLDAARGVVSERLTASVRRTGTDVFAIVAPRSFVFTRLRAAIVVALAVDVGTWHGTLELEPRPLRPGDTYTLLLPGG